MIPSAAPDLVTWTTERQVTPERPLNAGFLLSGIWQIQRLASLCADPVIHINGHCDPFL